MRGSARPADWREGSWAIASWLNERGHRRRRGGLWSFRSVLTILRNCVYVGEMVIDQIEAIEATLHLGLSNARVEAINTRLRLIARRAYGFHTPDAMIALAMLNCGAVRPTLPGRAA
jgi:transposase